MIMPMPESKTTGSNTLNAQLKDSGSTNFALMFQSSSVGASVAQDGVVTGTLSPWDAGTHDLIVDFMYVLKNTVD